MAYGTASERNARALDRLILERQQADARRRIAEANVTLRTATATKGQRDYAKRKRTAAQHELDDVSTIRHATRWRAYRLNYPTRSVQTMANAQDFLDGFGSMGRSGVPNRRGGYVADDQQRRARATYEKAVQRASLAKWDQVYGISDEWWQAWRDQYNETYLV